MTIREKKFAITATLAAVAILIPLGHYLRAGDTSLHTEVSPTKRYKVEFRSASNWQVMTHALADELADELVYVRLHLPSGKVVDSDAFDLSGSGPTLWTDNGGVQVGTTAIYEPENERWSVEW